jgi:hopanoid biosynthesis associated protein HpnK
VSRRCIINADDFGVSPGVNRGIVESFRNGVLTSTTMLVNLPWFDDAVAAARDNPDLPLGIHLSLLWGPPVAGPAAVPTLVESGGLFPRSLTVLARRHFLGRLDPQQVRAEFRAQVRKFLDAGLTPTHVDTHKHVHCLAGILRELIAVAREFGIRRVRLPYERGWRLRPVAGGPAPPSTTWRAAFRRNLIRFLCRGSRARLREAGIATTDRFVGIRHQAVLNSDVLYLILDSLPNGVTEIMCHPGYLDEALREYSRIPPHRERELAALTDPRIREHVERAGIELIHYGEL